MDSQVKTTPEEVVLRGLLPTTATATEDDYGRQLYHPTQDLLRPHDLIPRLPVEVTEMVIQKLDESSLFSCCQVSKTWQDIVNNCTLLWKNLCTQEGVGLCVQQCESAADYKQTYRRCRKRIRQIQGGTAFEKLYLEGHTDLLTTVSYRDGILATASKDRTVRLWDCKTGECTRIYDISHVAYLKFDSNYLFTALFHMFDKTVACWDIKSGQRLQTFVGNLSKVMSLDYNIEADLLLTGCCTGRLMIWSISSGQMLKTCSHIGMIGDRVAIIQVVLMVTNTAPNMTILSLSVKGIQLCMIDRVTMETIATRTVQMSGDFRALFKLVRCRHTNSPLYSTYHPDSDRCTVSQILLPNDIETARDLVVHQTPIQTDGKMLAFLGKGHTFSAVITDAHEQRFVEVIKNSDNSLVGKIALPHNFLHSVWDAHVGMVLGDQSWLNGISMISEENTSATFLAGRLADHRILLLKWINTDL